MTEKPKRPDRTGEYVCHAHKDKNGEPYFTTSSNEFNDHIMTEHVDAFWKRIKASEENRKLKEQMNLSKKGKVEK